MLVYPNQLDIPLMENSGLAKPPVGMLEITVEKAIGLKSGDMLGKGDPYVSIQVQVCMLLATSASLIVCHRLPQVWKLFLSR